MIPLSDRDLHLWCADPNQLDSPSLQQRAGELLTGEERERVARMAFPAGRRLQLATRVLVRTVLSRYQPVAPAAWRFVANDHGRPAIADPASPLCFNLTNTDGLVACAVTRGIAVGVDAEQLDRHAPLDVAARFFAPFEVAALERLDPADRPRRFFDYWTLKESYIKARGLGLALSLQGFWFHLDGEAAPRIEVDPQLGDTASWIFAQRRPTRSHLLALCVLRQAGGDPIITEQWQSLLP